MTIKAKIFTAGLIIFLLFIILAFLNLRTYSSVLANIEARDAANRKLYEVEEFQEWKTSLIRYISDSLATESISETNSELLQAPPDIFKDKSDLLTGAGRALEGYITQKEQALKSREIKFNTLHEGINDLYLSLDKEIATELARSQMNQVLGLDYTDQNFLAPYVLKSLNQLTLVALNNLISMSYTEENRGIVRRNRQFLSSQLYLMDPEKKINNLFEELFSRITEIDSFIKKSSEEFERINTQIEKSSKAFFNAVDVTETESIVRETRQAVQTANDKLEKTSRRAFVVMVVFLFAMPGIVIFLGIFGLNTLIIAPITELIKVMKEIEAGNFNVSAPVHADNEIGTMARAFNIMTKEIRNKITELSDTNNSLRESEARYRILVDNLPQSIFLKNIKSEYISCNRNYAKLLHIDQEEIRGKSDFDFYPEEIAEKYRKDDAAVMASEESIEHEESFYTDKTKLTVLTNKIPIRNENGEVNRVLGIFWDITQRKKDEEELRKARYYIANIINSMPSILIGIDSSGNITQWNEKAREATGIEKETASGNPLEEVFPPLAPVMEHVLESIGTKKIYKETKKSGDNEKTAVYEDITVYPLESNGAEGAVIRIDDVTEKVRLEEMMIQSEKMLSVGGLAAGMAHEINNPLAGILQTIGVMRKRLESNLNIPANMIAAESAGTTIESIEKFMENRKIFRMMETVETSAKRVAEIVNNMLSFARKSDSALSSHPIEALIDKTLELAETDYNLKKKYDFKSIAIKKEYNSGNYPVPCEATKIQQVLLNIFQNGAQAMDSGNVINPGFIIRTMLDREKRFVSVEIEDNGPGMDEDTRKRVFEPFFTTKPVGIGTGLGLSVSYFIITQNHKGEMTVKSQPGKGSNFIIRLPFEGENG